MFSLWLVRVRFIHNKFQDLLEELACHEKTVRKSDLSDSSDWMKPANILLIILYMIGIWHINCYMESVYLLYKSIWRIGFTLQE